MKVGIPREIKNHEYRVAITPAGVHELVRGGHQVVIEAGAGEGSSIPDEDFVAAGAKILPTADDVWGEGEMILKVKEPIAEEYHRMRSGQVLFTYLHLAASKACTDALISSGITSIAYETVQLPDGSLPLLAPMSEVAGRMAPQVGAHHLQRDGGGRGVLMGGVSGVYAAKVVVLGAGVSGMNAAAIALGMQAEVLLVDRNVGPAPPGRRHLPGALPDRRVQHLRDRACGHRRRPGHRRGAGARGQGAPAGHRRARVPDEEGRGARRHLHRPGRLLRGLAAHHARRPHLPGARRAVLLRGEHAGRRAAHVHLRADQRHAAVRGRDGQPRLARRAARRCGPGPGPVHARRPADLRAGRRSARAAVHPGSARF